jgi:hypothetical protein
MISRYDASKELYPSRSAAPSLVCDERSVKVRLGCRCSCLRPYLVDLGVFIMITHVVTTSLCMFGISHHMEDDRPDFKVNA